MLVKPAPGRAIRDPGTMQLVPDDGQEVDPSDLFWARVLMDGDLVEAAAPPPPATPAILSPPAPPASSGPAAPLKPEGNDA